MNDEQKLRAFVAEIALLEEGEIGQDTPLISGGHIDSMNLLQIVNYVEEQNGISVLRNQLTLDNWDTTARIAAYIQARKSSPTGS